MKKEYKIYAVDFDGTLCQNQYPDIGEANSGLISFLRKAQEAGDKLILWTCREGETLEAAIEWSRKHGITYDSVNENIPEHAKNYTQNSRKVYADVYIDDRAVPSIQDPDKLQAVIESMKRIYGEYASDFDYLLEEKLYKECGYITMLLQAYLIGEEG